MENNTVAENTDASRAATSDRVRVVDRIIGDRTSVRCDADAVVNYLRTYGIRAEVEAIEPARRIPTYYVTVVARMEIVELAQRILDNRRSDNPVVLRQGERETIERANEAADHWQKLRELRAK
jgi:hypothetical protein